MFALLSLRVPSIPSERVPSTPTPAPAPQETATLIHLPSPSVRAVNGHMLAKLCHDAQQKHGALEEFEELRTAATRAMGRFPIPVLGPGIARQLVDMEEGRDAYRNVLGVQVHADELLRRGEASDTADAFVRAFAAFKELSLSATRARLLQAQRDCEFFSPELTLILEALRY